MTVKKESRTYLITEEVFSQIHESIGSHTPETGGILGSSDGKHIDHFYFDATANITGATCEPDHNELNRVIGSCMNSAASLIGKIFKWAFALFIAAIVICWTVCIIMEI
ncbi:hypothetical protein D7X94_05455 [Acutalibacter sp. 1XD8-33]|uniref:hypothetical protein n=1 Tax=Acutalibacter sp. 1XD8-33 TaxID=2320081 RepID=UPI000EA30E3A|nr:hypothetical protein [Acutalibacter sp. 1XD8-33]RKJ41241.1 hypothetical protein D7X94_05455 [Acutalibacter sp. 1XD8-33]